MEDQVQDTNNQPSHGSEIERNEPVRSRWTPKPEQILILESIFNSGMVNPPKNETVRIRKVLEKYGSVGDANVFYWFQNRRSRSRRRQRQIQANLAGEQQTQTSSSGSSIQCENINSNSAGFASNSLCCPMCSVSCSLIGYENYDNLFSFSGAHPGLQDIEQNPSIYCPAETSNLQYQSGLIAVFINGIPTEVPRGAVDMKSIFGEEFILFHSSGVPVQVNEFGFLLQSLQQGESYFLVPRNS
ncbi:WUSCHEL-related homeobox 11-like [Olea europaea subsp. europaea]|uniref:Protein WUSCHEL n=1 Tax=Olea europaea subsp. europaea TaxID=158383 RepID=A0A8S0T2A5_OLEEU|nr:WUSCHEL-related homeobox 11-like [Olea europaea subsp. europaea]